MIAAAAAAFAAAWLQAAAVPPPASPPSASPPSGTSAPADRPYVDGFCAPIAGGYASGAGFYRHLADWGARPGPSAEGDALRPRDLDVPGQFMRFEPSASGGAAAGASTPDAYVDARSGACALVWPGSAAPASAWDELRRGALPVGEGGAAVRWRPVRPVFAGPPRPPRFLLPLGPEGDRGLCAEVDEDARARDGRPVSVVRLSGCRLGSGETTAAG